MEVQVFSASLYIEDDKMKLVMTLLVRNEEDILDENIRFHLAQGIDFFIVMKHKSQDRTADILRRYQNQNVMEVIHQTSDSYNQAIWVTAMARRAAVKYEADWIINNDADEFWMPQSGSLKTIFESLNQNVSTISANRFDFYYRPFKQAKFYEALLFREAQRQWTKCAHRAAHDIEVEIGNHFAYAPSFGEKSMVSYPGPGPIDILHFPIRSLEHYREKIVAGTIDMLKTPGLDKNAGFHWKQDFQRVQNKSFEEYFKTKTFAALNIMQGIKEEKILIDDRLQKFFLSNKANTQ